MSIQEYKGAVAVDDRGSVRFVNDFDFKNVKRFYQVENHASGFIRAWHGHKKEAKYVYVARGSALIGVVPLIEPLHPASPKTFVLSDKVPKVLYIPEGHANGFKTLEPNTILMFFSTSTLDESKNDDIRFPYNEWNIWDIIPR